MGGPTEPTALVSPLESRIKSSAPLCLLPSPAPSSLLLSLSQLASLNLDAGDRKQSKFITNLVASTNPLSPLHESERVDLPAGREKISEVRRRGKRLRRSSPVVWSRYLLSKVVCEERKGQDCLRRAEERREDDTQVRKRAWSRGSTPRARQAVFHRPRLSLPMVDSSPHILHRFKLAKAGSSSTKMSSAMVASAKLESVRRVFKTAKGARKTATTFLRHSGFS